MQLDPDTLLPNAGLGEQPPKRASRAKRFDRYGQTPFARACSKGEYELAKQRLEEQPKDINVPDYAGNSPLHIVALQGYDNLVKLLVDNGCNLDHYNRDGNTPLLDAVENGHVVTVRVLLEGGADPRAPNAKRQRPIDRISVYTEDTYQIWSLLRDAMRRYPVRDYPAAGTVSTGGGSRSSPAVLGDKNKLKHSALPPEEVVLRPKRRFLSQGGKNVILRLTP